MAVRTIIHRTFNKGSIFEVKFTELSQTADKKDRFQWFLLFNDKRYTLNFERFIRKSRIFSCKLGTVVLHDDSLQIESDIIELHEAWTSDKIKPYSFD